MDNSNQPTQATRENHETLKVSTSSDPHHSPKMLLIGLGAFLIIIIGGGIGYFLGVNNQPMPNQTPTPTPLTKASAKVEVDETANWKTYDKKGYSFKYPSDWKVVEIDYLNSTQLNNPNQTVSILISEGQYPFGFEDPDTVIKQQELKLTVGEKEYDTKEVTINNSSIFVNLKLDTQKSNFLLFGTGYPAGIDNKASIEDYNNLKETILTILSTFQFLEEDTTTSTPKPEVLNYFLAQGWSTVQDKTGTFEIGYDPNKFNPIASDKRIDLSSKQCCSDFFTMIKPYDGGSRHNFIYKSMQISGYNGLGAYDKTYEKNYTFNNKSGLYIYWISLSGTASVGMLDIDGTQALSLSSTGTDENLIESLISSVRFLK